MADLITYDNKVDNVVSGLPEINKVTADNMNELKSKINVNAAETDVNAAAIAALEAISGHVPFQLEFDDTGISGAPVTGGFRMNNILPSASSIDISTTDIQGRDISEALDLLVTNSYVYIQKRSNGDQSGFYKITSATDNGTYYSFTLLVRSGGGAALSDKDLCAFSFLPYYASSGSVAWGSITGTLSAQTDLQTELDEIGVNASNIADLEAVVTQRALYSATTTGTVALDCSTFDSWYRILTGNTAFTFTSTPASGTTFVRTLEVITTAGESLTFPTADNVIGTFVNDDTTVNLITINFANYPTLGLRITVVIS